MLLDCLFRPDALFRFRELEDPNDPIEDGSVGGGLRTLDDERGSAFEIESSDSITGLVSSGNRRSEALLASS